jgi:hypothetical protein
VDEHDELSKRGLFVLTLAMRRHYEHQIAPKPTNEAIFRKSAIIPKPFRALTMAVGRTDRDGAGHEHSNCEASGAII